MESKIVIKKEKMKKITSSDDIIKNAIKGDRDAIEIIIAEHKEYLYKIAFLYVKNEHEAIEICQETVYKIVINIHKLKNEKYFKTWITRILINNINDMNRYKRKFTNNVNEIESIGDISYEELEEKIDLYNAIDELEMKFKTPIILQYFHDMNMKEISKILDVNENTIKTYIRRGKLKLYKLLKEGKK